MAMGTLLNRALGIGYAMGGYNGCQRLVRDEINAGEMSDHLPHIQLQNIILCM